MYLVLLAPTDSSCSTYATSEYGDETFKIRVTQNFLQEPPPFTNRKRRIYLKETPTVRSVKIATKTCIAFNIAHTLMLQNINKWSKTQKW